MMKRKRTLKIYHGILIAVLTAGEIFIYSEYLGRWFGFQVFGTLVVCLGTMFVSMAVFCRRYTNADKRY